MVDRSTAKNDGFMFSKLIIGGYGKRVVGRLATFLMYHDSLSNQAGSNLVGIPITTLLALVHVRRELRARLFVAGELLHSL